MTTSIEWLLLFVIPEVTSSPEEQIVTLKRTLSKLDMLPVEGSMKQIVSSAMLKYMQYLDSPEKAHLKEYILGELTETELEGLLSLVESASEQLRKQESEKSAILRKTTHGGIHPGVAGLGGLGSPGPLNPWAKELAGKIDKSFIQELLKEKK